MNSIRTQAEKLYNEHGRDGAKAYAENIADIRPIWLEEICEWIDYFADMAENDYSDENDGQPDEAQEWYDYDPDC